MRTVMRLSAMVLAAGRSERMGHPKALLRFGERTFLEEICARLRSAGLRETVVVLGAAERAVRAGVRLKAELIVVNERYASGQLSSLRCGLEALDPSSGAALVALVDHPLVAAATYAGLAEEWRKTPGKIVMATYRGRGGHPVVFPRRLFAELAEAPLEGGARPVVNRDARRVRRIEFEDPGIISDIDSPADYARWIAPGRSVPEGGAA